MTLAIWKEASASLTVRFNQVGEEAMGREGSHEPRLIEYRIQLTRWKLRILNEPGIPFVAEEEKASLYGRRGCGSSMPPSR